MHAGTFTLENDGGCWVGTVWGFWGAVGTDHYYVQAEGQGGYEGRMLPGRRRVHLRRADLRGDRVIVPGDLPAVE